MAAGGQDVEGRRLASVRVITRAGEIALPGTRVLAAGVFLARLSVGTRMAVAKLVALPQLEPPSRRALLKRAVVASSKSVA